MSGVLGLLSDSCAIKTLVNEIDWLRVEHERMADNRTIPKEWQKRDKVMSDQVDKACIAIRARIVRLMSQLIDAVNEGSEKDEAVRESAAQPCMVCEAREKTGNKLGNVSQYGCEECERLKLQRIKGEAQ